MDTEPEIILANIYSDEQSTSADLQFPTGGTGTLSYGRGKQPSLVFTQSLDFSFLLRLVKEVQSLLQMYKNCQNWEISYEHQEHKSRFYLCLDGLINHF